MLKKIQIEPTNKCNFACKMCRRTNWQRDNGDISVKNFGNIIYKIPHVENIHIQGMGEPFLHPNILELFKIAKTKCQYVTTTTNASLLNPINAEDILRSGLSHINISLDTMDENIFNKTRPGICLRTILRNIKSFIETRNDILANCTIAIGSVAKKDTINNAIDVINFSKEVGADFYYLQNLHTHSKNSPYYKNNTIKKKDAHIVKLIEKIHKISNLSNRLTIFVPSFFQSNRRATCRWPRRGVNITWDGYVTSCCLQPDPTLVHFGNIFTTSFDDIWNSKKYNHFRKAYEEGDYQPCLDCKAYFGQMWNEKMNL